MSELHSVVWTAAYVEPFKDYRVCVSTVCWCDCGEEFVWGYDPRGIPPECPKASFFGYG